MFNEFILVFHSILISLFVVIALKNGKEALIALVCIQAVLSNLFVTKQIIIFGLCATCSDAFSIGSGISLNLLQEYYGKNTANKTIWLSFFILIFYLLMTQIHLLYLPSLFDLTQSHYYEILKTGPRIIIVSLISYFISQKIDVYTYGFLRNKFAGKFFLIRNYGSLLLSQLFDTLFFSFFGLFGLVQNVWQIFIISYIIKIFTIIIAVPIVTILKRLIRTN